MSRRILIVEDQEDNRRILRDLLTSAGYDLVEATDGLEGVERAATERPDLILMDMRLPGIDGWEATRRLKSDPETRTLPIIALTAHAMADDRDRALAAGCDDHLVKPLDPARLLDLLRERCAGKEKAAC